MAGPTSRAGLPRIPHGFGTGPLRPGERVPGERVPGERQSDLAVHEDAEDPGRQRRRADERDRAEAVEGESGAAREPTAQSRHASSSPAGSPMR